MPLVEHMVKQCAICLEHQHTQPQEKGPHFDIPCIPWEVVGADVFMVNGKNLFFIVGYHSKFPKSEESKQLISR